MHLSPPKPLLKPWHSTEYAGRSMPWFAGDSPEHFALNCQTKKGFARYCRRTGWDQPGIISYDFNCEGFRGPEFQSGPDSMITLGCSFTFGSGLPVHLTWPAMLARRLNRHLNNLSWPGASLDACFRWAEYWVPQLAPGLVILMMPPAPRIELILDQADRRSDSYGIYMDNVHKDWYTKTWMSVEENQRLNQSRNCLAIQAVCDRLAVPCWIYDSMSFISRGQDQNGYARDWLHPGPPCHNYLVEYVLDDKKLS